MTQKVVPANKLHCIQYGQTTQNSITGETDVQSRVIIVADGLFRLFGNVNTQSVRYWGSENLQIIEESGKILLKVTVL